MRRWDEKRRRIFLSSCGLYFSGKIHCLRNDHSSPGCRKNSRSWRAVWLQICCSATEHDGVWRRGYRVHAGVNLAGRNLRLSGAPTRGSAFENPRVLQPGNFQSCVLGTISTSAGRNLISERALHAGVIRIVWRSSQAAGITERSVRASTGGKRNEVEIDNSSNARAGHHCFGGGWYHYGHRYSSWSLWTNVGIRLAMQSDHAGADHLCSLKR